MNFNSSSQITNVNEYKSKRKEENLNTNLGKRSLLRKSQRRKPKRTSKNLQTITTSKCGFKLITTTTSLHQNCLFSSSLL